MKHHALTDIFSFGILLATPYLPDIDGRGGIIMASASTPSANEPAKDLSLVHIVQLKPMIKVQISGRMVSSGIRCSVRFSILRENPSEEVDDIITSNTKIIY